VRKHHFIGGRIIKTGIAVLATALICDWFHWPPVFAVITSIVSIEPTVMDSIKKGLVRFPASAIGSAFAVCFISLFHDSPITYTAATVFTIFTCYKLKLHEGLLVATLTSVAMVDVIHSNLLIAFFIRLGTTTIGLSVSALVNFLILPPKYSLTISKRVTELLADTGKNLTAIIETLLNEKNDFTHSIDSFLQAREELDKAERLCQFQKEEWRFHRFTEVEYQAFYRDEFKIQHLRKIHYHLGNLMFKPHRPLRWTKSQKNIIISLTESLVHALKTPAPISGEHKHLIKEAREQFKSLNLELYADGSENNTTVFSPEFIILYEMLSIFELIEALYSKPYNYSSPVNVVKVNS
jgi:uncharacterized membrane protein YgaE (UPF0421/DUF939 family)